MTSKEEPRGILTEEDTANWLRIKRDTLRKWRREGCGPDYIRCGERLIRYFITDIVEWLSKKKSSGPTDEINSKRQKRKSVARSPVARTTEGAIFLKNMMKNEGK